jgi:hypothetical protein
MKRRPLVKVIKRIHGAYQWGRYGVNRALGTYRRNIVVDGDPTELGENLCIFSIFSAKGGILRSTLSLLKAVRKEGYSLVVVVNGQKITRGWFEGEIGTTDVVISRPNLGRDFAAYQIATNLLLDSKLSISRLLYCNDSIFYLDRNDPRNIFAHLMSSGDHWTGMTENYEHSYHVSSWCFQLSKEILNSPAFFAFWRNYRPVDSRRHAIRQGEIGFSQMLLKAGYIPTIIFNTSSLLKTVLNKHKPRNEKLLLQQLCTPSPGTTPQVELSGILASLFRGEQLNQTNNLGILLVSELGFPFLKKTMAFAANCPISLMLIMLEEFMSGFCDETAIEIRMRGIRRNLSPWKRLLVDAGVI